MKVKAKHIAVVVVLLLVAWGVYSFASKPSYPDIITPKPVRNNPDASVQIVEFGDIQCPACGAAHPVLKQVLEDYGDKIGYQFYHFPLTQIHPYAMKASEAAECASDQGKFFDYLDFAYANQNDLSTPRLEGMAETLGLDTVQFNACLGSGKKRKVVQADLDDGRQRFVQSTPTFFVNGRRLPDWRYPSFTAVINEALGAS